jgi:hypothetical protein
MFNIFQERRIRNFSIHIRKNFYSLSYYFTGAKEKILPVLYGEHSFIFLPVPLLWEPEKTTQPSREKSTP